MFDLFVRSKLTSDVLNHELDEGIGRAWICKNNLHFSGEGPVARISSKESSPQEASFPHNHHTNQGWQTLPIKGQTVNIFNSSDQTGCSCPDCSRRRFLHKRSCRWTVCHKRRNGAWPRTLALQTPPGGWLHPQPQPADSVHSISIPVTCMRTLLPPPISLQSPKLKSKWKFSEMFYIVSKLNDVTSILRQHMDL